MTVHIGSFGIARRMRNVILCIALAAICPNARASQYGLPQPVVPDGFGINVHATHFEPGERSLLCDAGLGFVRTDMRWENVERTTGVYDFSAFDGLVKELDSCNLRGLFILDYGNPNYDGGLSPFTDAGRAAFAKFAAAATARYANKGIVWEIWNEPNAGDFWKPLPNVRDYALLVKSAASAMRKADPKATIVAGAVGGMSMEYIESFLRTGSRVGAFAQIAALSVHPYRETKPETVGDGYMRVRSIIARYTPPGQNPLRLICSEWGYSTAAAPHWTVPEDVQAAYMLREYLWNLANGVDLTIWYDWKDVGSDPSSVGGRYGIVTHDFKPKASYTAVRNLIRGLRGYRFSHRLLPDKGNDCRLLFESQSDLAIVAWSSRDNNSPTLPTIRKVRPGDADYSEARRAASIAYSPEPRVAVTGSTVRCAFRLTNTGGNPAVIGIMNGNQGHRFLVAPRENKDVVVDLSVDAATAGPHPIDLDFTWNGTPVRGIDALMSISASVLDVQTEPKGRDLSVYISNPVDRTFSGAVVLKPKSGRQIEASLTLEADRRKVVTLAGAGAAVGDIELIDKAGLVWGRVATDPDVPKGNWPVSATQAVPLKHIFYSNNQAASTDTPKAVATPPNSPAPLAILCPFTTGRAWTYNTLEPLADDPIPDGAKALVVWIKGDGHEIGVFSRFTDATGQTFQVSGGRITDAEWRRITFPLDGSNADHWAGSNDGTPHGKLSCTMLLLLDSHGGETPEHSGSLLAAAPAYAMP
ncbi:MAG: cellulase family glycosylhydrolase [Capsulimonadaceae bacterium]|nr:cellulase family glycosylhydrolase [Capsulimonadaceae bacterium]